eukprot:919038-Pelagomonas_calceolata.AAC.2
MPDPQSQVKVQALDFSFDDSILASLGGPDDNSLYGIYCDVHQHEAKGTGHQWERKHAVLWDVESGTAICGSPTHTNFTLCVKFFNNRNDKLITGGNYNLHVWEYDRANNKLRPQEAALGQLQRAFKSITVDNRDQYAYCGTSSGDVLQVGAEDTGSWIPRYKCLVCSVFPMYSMSGGVDAWVYQEHRFDLFTFTLEGPVLHAPALQIGLERVLFKNSGPGKDPIQMGVTASAEIPTGDLLIGGGDGSLVVLKTHPEASPSNPKLLKKMVKMSGVRVEGAITSIVLDGVQVCVRVRVMCFKQRGSAPSLMAAAGVDCRAFAPKL